ncbi:MAG: GNAT family N-acetyltransferase [Oscillospiraceae bacterium]|jgi:RimJ/RimL family protein N-acetyltransferase|nr:GNAT family N-acetyltransferase [Oscillospiraceae bacterium]
MRIEMDGLTIRNATAMDAAQLAAWWNDGAVMAHAGFPLGLHTSAEEVVAKLATDSDDTTRRHIIEQGGRPIGEMNYRNQGGGLAEIGIKICDATAQNKGIGTLLLTAFVDALYRHMGYEVIDIDTNLKNTRAQKVYEQKLGFRRVGVKENSWQDQLGVWQSAVFFQLTKAEWIAKHPVVDYRFALLPA